MQCTTNAGNRKNGAGAPAPESGAPGGDPSALARVQPGPSDAEYESVTRAYWRARHPGARVLVGVWRGSQLIESVTVPTDEGESSRRTQRRENVEGPTGGPSLDAVAAFRRTGFYRELMALCVLARDLRDGLARTREDDHELWVMCESAHTLGDRLGRFWNRDQGELACEFGDAGVARDPVTDEYPPGVERLIELAELRRVPVGALALAQLVERLVPEINRASEGREWEERDALILALSWCFEQFLGATERELAEALSEEVEDEPREPAVVARCD